MKSIKVRDLQHHLSRVLDQVERGESVQILRRNRPVARIVPLGREASPQPWPDLLGRLRGIYGKQKISSPTSSRIYDDREDT